MLDNSISEISYVSVTLQYCSMPPIVTGNVKHFEESKLFCKTCSNHVDS